MSKCIIDDKKQFGWMLNTLPFIGDIFKDDCDSLDCESDNQKEIHFISKLNENGYVSDVKADYESTKKAIDNGDDFILTTQFCFLMDADKIIDNGYKIYIHTINNNVYGIA